MLLQKDNWRLGYHQIISDCRASITHSTGGTVLILVNPDADALCAGRILSYALRADKVPYQLRPCGGFNCLLKILEKLALNGDEMEGSSSTIRAVVLLNLGATRNLQKTLFEPSVGYGENNEEIVSPPLLDMEQTKLYVLDSHRPYHLANIYAQKNIVLWNDENFWHTDEGGIPSDGEYLDDESDESESEDEDDSDDDSDGSDSKGSDSESEAEFDDVNGNGKLKKDDGDLSDASVDLEGGKRASAGTPKSERRKKARTDPDTPDIRDTDDENDKDNASIVEKEMADKPIISMREKHKLRRDKVRKYYSNGSFHSSPVAFMAYILLAEQLRHDSIGDLLWLACVGVSDAFVHHRLDLTGYAKLVVDLQEKIEKIYPDLRDDDRTTERMVNTAFAEDLYEKENYNGPTTEVGFSENGKILYQREEFRFFLLRHTSLWDAMILSPDLNTKMELWRSSGIKKLQEMLAKMGLPLAQCQQPYAFMKPSLKRRLKLMMNEHEEEYGLEHLKYTAFIRVSGYKSLLSASDMSLAVTALLECDTSKSKDSMQNGDNGAEAELDEEEEEERSLMSSFNIAYDALNSNGSSSTFATIGGGGLGGSTEGADLSTMVNGGDVNGNNGLGAGIRLAMSVQKAIISTAVSLVERKAITRLSHFRYAYLHATSHGANGSTKFQGGKDDSNKQHTHHIFSKPLALTKLANYLMDMHRANNKWSGTKALPLVLLAEKPQTQSYLVVGFEYPSIKGSVKRNSFKDRFEMAANTLKDGEFLFDSFDSNVIEVKSDVGRFIEQLHYMIDSVVARD